MAPMAVDLKELTDRIARRLRRAREVAGLSQTEVAEQLNVRPNTVCGWECGDRMPRAPELHTLSELYSCTSDYLLGRAEHATSLPVGELLVDQEVVNQILRAKSPADIEELVDWQPQMISFWQVVKGGTRVRTRQHVQALTFELMSHVQKVAPPLWQLYEDAVQEFKKSQLQWTNRRDRHNATGSD